MPFKPKINMMHPDQIKAAPWNPPKRTAAGKKLSELMEAITELGGIVQPIIVSKDNRLIDGHRRLEAARRLKMTEVPVIITPLSLQQGYAVLNSTALKIGSRDWVQILSSGFEKENLPELYKRQVVEAGELMGPDFVGECASRGQSLYVVRQARRLALYILRSELDKEEEEEEEEEINAESDEFRGLWARACRWAFDHSQQAAISAAIKDRVPAKVIRYAIDNDLPLRK